MKASAYALVLLIPPAIAQMPAAAPVDLPVPRIPPIVIPDVVNKTPEQTAFEQSLPLHLDPASGIRIEPARCEQGNLILANGTIQSRSGDRATQINDQGILTVNADGSGTLVREGLNLRVNADGSGNMVRTIDGTSFTIKVNADGSGTYVGPEGSIMVDGKGGGTWSGDHGSIRIHADGSGTWSGDQGAITINADGSGRWVGEVMQTNHGDGTGTYDAPAKTVAMAPWPPAPKVGKLDLLQPFAQPGNICGYLITLDDRVLFDFDRYDLRADAAQVIDALSDALGQVKAQRMEIRGHTDSKGSDEYNQTLSENRARTVQQALQSRTAIAQIDAHGYGESQPVAPNEVDGKDSPENRQLNRRVEIFVKTQ